MDGGEGLLATTIREEEDGDENAQMDTHSDSSQDEDECRVCRGPEEEGRPLFSPCKCSGSIGLTHQDCLTSWLAVTRGEGRCELCKVKFHFAPQYAEDAPDRLAVPEVLMGLARRAVARWLPFLLRLSFCISLWLVVAPLVTSYLYLILMNRSISCIFERWDWQLAPADAVSGAVLTAIILISFLSLMSFADFLRVEWQQQQQQQQPDPVEADAGRRLRQERVEAVEDNRQRHHEVNNALILRLERAQQEAQGNADTGEHGDNPEHLVVNANGKEARNDNSLADQIELVAADNLEGRVNEDINDVFQRNVNQDNWNENVLDARNVGINDNEAVENPIRNNVQPPPQGQVQRINPRQDRQLEANMNVDPLLPDDQVDMEINVALDELLGLRGPISSLLRNLLWLLVFNFFYLGTFAFVPHLIGSFLLEMLSLFHNVVDHLPVVREKGDEEMLSLKSAVEQVNQESKSLNSVFRLPDFAAVNLGYLFCATLIIMLRLAWILVLKCRGIVNINEDDTNNEAAVNPGVQVATNDANGDQEAHPRHADVFDNPRFALGEAVSLILDAAVSIVKIGLLLAIKMFLLPVLLGVWLDGSSMELFGSNAEDRILYAGSDLFSFVLLHWVAGITFMLLVTVSVLQLREVAHANLLAHLIRPQEPQPDLLGNLMHDSVVTQTKRMLLSLGIYTVLLHLHVSLPVKLLMTSGISDLLPFLKLRFWHLVMPQLQVPVELLVFHLSMLALLEKYKNSIGEMQHHWLLFMCTRLGLAHFILPHEVAKFELAGLIPVFSKDLNVNPVLFALANETREGVWEEMVVSNIEKPDIASETEGETRDSGERVLKTSEAYICLPCQGSLQGNSNDTSNGEVLLSTKKGRYRLKLREDPDMTMVEVWSEGYGTPIPRPPAGWDDLGAGGADIQGRWAWGKEKQSVIEKGVARREHFFGSRGQSGAKLASLLGRVALLLLSSWIATTLLLVILVSAPLGLGRLLYLILRVPEANTHYPLVFAAGSAIAFPTIARASSLVMFRGNPLQQSLIQWIRSFRSPPLRKALVLLATLACWCLLCPLALGLIYDLCLIKSPSWFSGDEDLFRVRDLTWIWVTGTTLLNAWACLCSLNVFTKQFWVNVGNGMLEVEVENRRERQDNGPMVGREDDDDSNPRWQGRDGRMARFFSSLKTICARWEWDAIDHVVLLLECSLPVSKHLGTLLVAPSLCYLLWFWSVDALLDLGEIDGRHRLYVFRLASFSTLLVQLCISFRKHIQRWFGAIHEHARNDRYLIGEILLNYQADMES